MKSKNHTLIKKVASISLIVSLFFTMFSFTAIASNDIKVLLDGNPIAFDVPPQIIDGRTMVPIRAIFEAMGAEVTWDVTTKTAIALKGNSTIKMSVGSNQFTIDSKLQSMDSSPVIINGRTLAPARYVAESFGYTVEWDEDSRIVNINSSEIIEDPFKAFYEVMKGYWQTWKYDDSSVYYLNNINQFVNVHNTDVTVSYDIERNIISFRMEHRTENNITISMYLNLNYNNNNADVHLSLYPIAISGEGLLNNKSFTSNSLLDFDFSNTNRVNSICNQITKDSVDLTLKIVEDFLIASGTNLRLKDLGFESFDAGKITVSQSQSKIVAFYEMVEKENKPSPSVSSTGSSIKNNSSYYPGTTLPTYTSVTGISIKEIDYLSNGNPLYIYRFTNSDDVSDYWDALYSYGWNLFESDDTSTTNTFESSFYKENKFIIINVYFNYDEVWITYN